MSPPTKTPVLKDGIVLNGKWEILGHIATGGKGEVYRARQTNLDRDVVVKTVSVEYLAEIGDDPEDVETEIGRFHREAMAMAQIRHPYVVQIFDQDSATIQKGGAELCIQYVVMEYVPGDTLRATMPDAGFSGNDEALQKWIRAYFFPVLEGLTAIHDLGIVHRDMKPENVLLDGTTPKITDFGLAGGMRWDKLTRSHHVEGTILYMPPEQFTDLGDTDARADIYALGKMLYEAVRGKMTDHQSACPLRGVCLPNPTTRFLKGLDVIIQEATAEDKELRPGSVRELSKAIEALIAKDEAARRPILRGIQRKQVIALAAVVVMLAVAFVASHLYHHYFMKHEQATTHEPSSTHEQITASHPEVAQRVEAPKAGGQSHGDQNEPHMAPEKPTLEARDGSTMHLIPAGTVKVPKSPQLLGSSVVEVAPFYLDETEVTNQRFVAFLNASLPRIRINRDMVLGDGRPWMRLGPVYTGYEPIVYRNDKFSLSDERLASYPVVQVTAHAATEYSAFYRKRLPTEWEWLYATGRTPAQPGMQPAKSVRQAPNLEAEMEDWLAGYQGESRPLVQPQVSPGPAQIPHAVMGFAPSSDGIRGLQENIGEWGLRPGTSSKDESRFVVLGGLGGTLFQGGAPISGQTSDPADAFADVGFRCAADAPSVRE